MIGFLHLFLWCLYMGHDHRKSSTKNKHQLLLKGLNTPSKKKKSWNTKNQKKEFEVLKHPPTWCFRRWFRSFFFHLISKAHRTKRKISTDNLVGSGTPFRGGWNETAETGVQGDLLRLKSESNSTPIPSMGLVYLPRFTRNTSQMYTYGLFGYRLFTIYLHMVESYGKCREI